MPSTVDVLTVSKRKGWEQLASECMLNQTMHPRKWIVVHEDDLEWPAEPKPEIIKAPLKKYHSNLNASLNEGLRHCTAEYVLFYQDFIELQPNTIEKLVKAAEETKGFVTTATINPDGNHDDRYTGLDDIRLIYPEQWETNVAIAPLKALRELGGFDEEYDKGWSWDNCSVAVRADMLGYNFYIDESIKPKLHFHVKEPDADPTLELNDVRHEMSMAMIRAGKKPIKLNYL